MADKQIEKLAQMSLLQMAAEAYLPSSALGDAAAVKQALEIGNRNFSQFTPTQAADFVDRYEVFAILSNDPSGAAATVFRTKQPDPVSGQIEYTLAIRSAEIAPNIKDERDAAAMMSTLWSGFSLGQLDAIDRAFGHLFSVPGLKVNITGAGLGAHLADLLSQMYATSGGLGGVYSFNGFGTGELPAGTTVSQALARYREVYDDPYKAFGYTREYMATVDQLPLSQAVVDARTIKSYVDRHLALDTPDSFYGYKQGLAVAAATKDGKGLITATANTIGPVIDVIAANGKSKGVRQK